jgi:hypothetical protein
MTIKTPFLINKCRNAWMNPMVARRGHTSKESSDVTKWEACFLINECYSDNLASILEASCSPYRSAEDPEAIFPPFISLLMSISESPTFCCRSSIFSDVDEFVELDGDAYI